MRIMFLLLISISGYAQDTCDLFIEKDQFTGKKLAETRMYPFEVDGMTLIVSARKVATKTTTYLFLSKKYGLTCFKENAKAIILFIDETKKEIYNETGLSCQGNFGTSQRISKEIKAIRFYTTDGYIDFNIPNRTDASHLSIQLSCITKLKL